MEKLVEPSRARQQAVAGSGKSLAIKAKNRNDTRPARVAV
jgi:hypothetical protein